VRNPELSSFCGQLKLFAGDGKKYLSDVINEEGVRMLLTITPSKYKKSNSRLDKRIIRSRRIVFH
jgi:hypothetical protein